MDGRHLTFRLVGINNQNFVMQDEQTGSWWQQVTGRALFGPLAGRQLELVPHDEVSFALWRADHPDSLVLRPDAAVEADYEPADWERKMRDVPTVTTLPAGSPLPARALVVGIQIGDRSMAYPLDRARDTRLLMDVVAGVPLMVVVAEDGRSVRVFDRRVEGQPSEFVAKSKANPPVLVDLETGSEWSFGGLAVSGPRRGHQLRRITFILEYWFDWQTYHPETEVFRH